MWNLVNYGSWIISLLLILWMLWDWFKIDSSHSEAELTSSREGGPSLNILSGLVAGNFSAYWLGISIVALMSIGYYFSTMGLDSLMGLEFVRRLSKALEIAVPATVVFNYPTIRVLAPHLIQRLQLPLIEGQQEMASNASKDAGFAALPVDLSEEDALEVLIGKKGSRT